MEPQENFGKDMESEACSWIMPHFSKSLVGFRFCICTNKLKEEINGVVGDVHRKKLCNGSVILAKWMELYKQYYINAFTIILSFQG